MGQVIHTQLFPGVNLTSVHTGKFKSSYFGVSLLVQLDESTVAANALIPFVLRRGSREYPDMQAISARLDELYGGAVVPDIHKKGEIQCVSFSASFLDDAFALQGERLLEPAVSLLGELLLHPRTEDGMFCREYVEGERANIINRVRAQINDKRKYALSRLRQEMCRHEAFGIGKKSLYVGRGDIERHFYIVPRYFILAYRHLIDHGHQHIKIVCKLFVVGILASFCKIVAKASVKPCGECVL